jgi:ribosomal protein S19E (S16A)
MAKDVRGASELRRQEKVGDPQFADVAKASPTRFSVPVRVRWAAWASREASADLD